MNILRFKLLLPALLMFPLTALAHPFDIGLLHGTVQGNDILFTLELDPKAASELSGVKSEFFQPQEISAEKDILLAATLGESPIDFGNGKTCRWDNPSTELKQAKVVLAVTARCPEKPANWSLELPFFAHAPTTFDLVVKIDSDQGPFEAEANRSQARISFTPQTSHSWSQFIQMGIQHIGAIPSEWRDEKGFHFPDGIDHILFVFALVLGGGGVIGILKTVTGFTIGHSLTLAMATLGWIHISSRWVESAIALSIAIVAAESIFRKGSRNRWKIAMAFGLIHGLGFASALSDLHLNGSELVRALIGFNVGVELGQAVIVICLFPILKGLEWNSFTRRYGIPTCASVIFLIGSYWFVQRAFGV